MTNLTGTLNVLEATKSISPCPRVLFIGTAGQYGAVGEDRLPITETQPLAPMDPYSASKAAADIACFQYARSGGVPVVRVRSFNHTGPGQSERFAPSDFARQVALVEAGVAGSVRVGNLTSRRDFLDVRDVVRAYAMVISKGVPGEVYNVASGVGVEMRQLLDILLGLSAERIEVEEDPDRYRPVENPVSIGDATKLRKATGWQREIVLEKTLADLLDYWRERVSAGAPDAGRRRCA